jgi:uncharacterized membrane protein
MNATVLQAVVVFLSGILAGEEFVVRYGIQPALRKLDDRAHVAVRVALVRSLRVVVPSLMLPAALSVVIMLIISDGPAGNTFRWVGAVALAAFMLFSFLGTVPINMKVIDWDADDPPENWKATVLRWQRIDVLRSTAAIIAFASFVIALADRIP